jgi:hypothetical protein
MWWSRLSSEWPEKAEPTDREHVVPLLPPG